MREGAFLAGEPVGRRVDVVAVDEAVGDQLGANASSVASQRGSVGAMNLHEGHEQ